MYLINKKTLNILKFRIDLLQIIQSKKTYFKCPKNMTLPAKSAPAESRVYRGETSKIRNHAPWLKTLVLQTVSNANIRVY